MNTIRNCLYWLKCRVIPEYKHHIVYTGLEPGWHDIDEIMLYANMKLLCRYVDFECGGIDNIYDYTKEKKDKDYVPPEHEKINIEIITIYKWWTIDYPFDCLTRDDMFTQLRKLSAFTFSTAIDDDGTKVFSVERSKELQNDVDKYYALGDKINDDIQSMLIRLMTIRRYLWT